MNLRIGVAIAALSLVAATPAMAAPGSARNALTQMKALNLIVLGDASLNADVEGKSYIGGNVTGSASIGIGNAANSQFATESGFHSTLAVGGSVNANLNINHGNGSGNNYGAYVAGSMSSLGINATGGTFRVGGSIGNSVNLKDNTSLFVAGAVNGVGGASNTLVRAGSNNGQTQVGSGSSAFITGNANGVDASSGSFVQVGGAVSGNVNAAGASFSAGSYTGQNKLSVSGGAHYIIGGNVNAAEIGGGGGTLEVLGSISDMQGYSSGALVKAGGSIGGNGNGLGNGVTVYARGSIAGQNPNGASLNPNYKYAGDVGAAANAVAAPATPIVPVAPVVASLSSYTTQLAADMASLSSFLGTMTTTNTVSFANNDTELTFAFAGAPATAVFDLSAAQFTAATQFAFSFGSSSTPVIINIHGTSLNWNATASGSNLQSVNQQIIYNFLDATSLNVNRAVWGSVLAPSATVKGDTMNGTVVAKIFNQSGEVHLGTYARNINFLPPETSVTPEPAVWVQLITGFGLAGAVMRRRRRVTA